MIIQLVLFLGLIFYLDLQGHKKRSTHLSVSRLKSWIARVLGA